MTAENTATEAKRFLLWKGGQGSGLLVLAFFVPILSTPFWPRLPLPHSIRAPLAISLIIGEAILIAWSLRSSKDPVFALTIEGGFATLDRVKPPVPAIARAALTRSRIEHAHWSPPRGGVLDNPMVFLTLDPVWRLAIGSPEPWVGTHGMWRRRPKYMLGPSRWPEFIATLTAACEANQRGLGRK